MALDLPAIVQAPEQQQTPPDTARTMLAAQQIKAGQLAQQHAADLPGAISAYQGGDQGALAQIYADNPEVANSIQNLALRKQEVNQEGALQATEIAGQKQAQASAAIDLQIKQRDQQLQRTQMQGLAAQSALQTVTDMRNAKADPSQIQAVVKKLHDQYEQTTGEKAHPELADYNADPDMWMKNMTTIVQHGQMAGTIRAQMNMTPEQREFNYVKSLSPEDQQKYMAVKSGSPMMMGGPSDSSAPGTAPATAGAAANAPIKLTPEEEADQARGLNPTVLHQMPAQYAAQVKALAEGRMQFPAGFAMKSPYWQNMVSQVAAYDPSFDAVNYNARAKVRADMTSGKSRQNMNSIETALNTLASAKDASDALGGVNHAGIANSLVNKADVAIKESENSPELNTYNTLAKTAADEVTKAVTGAAGGVEDRAKRLEAFDARQSPEAREAAIKAAVKELNARLDPIASAYNQGMGTDRNGIELLSPKAQAAYQKLMGSAPDNARASGVQPPAAPPGVPTIKGPDDPAFKSLKPGEKFFSDGQIMVKH